MNEENSDRLQGITLRDKVVRLSKGATVSKEARSKLEIAWNQADEEKRAKISAILFGETIARAYKNCRELGDDSDTVEVFFSAVQEDEGWDYLKTLKLADAFAFLKGEGSQSLSGNLGKPKAAKPCPVCKKPNKRLGSGYFCEDHDKTPQYQQWKKEAEKRSAARKAAKGKPKGKKKAA